MTSPEECGKYGDIFLELSTAEFATSTDLTAISHSFVHLPHVELGPDLEDRIAKNFNGKPTSTNHQPYVLELSDDPTRVHVLFFHRIAGAKGRWDIPAMDDFVDQWMLQQMFTTKLPDTLLEGVKQNLPPCG